MNHPALHRVSDVEQVGTYSLRVSFDDGNERVIDFEPIVAGEVYGPLVEPALFSQVRIDSEAHTLVWPNGADFDPATLHDWPEYADAFRAAAERWKLAAPANV